MLRADDEVRVQRPRRGRIGPLAVELVEEARDEVQRRVRIDGLLAAAQPGERRERGGRERGQRARLLRRGRPIEHL